MPPSGGSYTARAIRDAAVVNAPDVLAETDPEYATKSIAAAAGYRSVLAVPMFRDRQVVGAIAVNRAEAGRFQRQGGSSCSRPVADQAVIAIENVRLFNETREALDQQRASGEILAPSAARSPIRGPCSRRCCRVASAFSWQHRDSTGRDDGRLCAGAYTRPCATC
jgi:transcriptional regulator with GAF, ATPase, and Fis domain